MPKILVPANQTVVLSGLKTYVGRNEVDMYLQEIGCPLLKFPSSPIRDKKDKETKLVYLNFDSVTEAAKALETIRKALAKPPIMFLAGKAAARLKGDALQEKPDSDSEDSDDEQSFADYLCEQLGSKGGSMPAAAVGSMPRKNFFWQDEIARAGGLKYYVEGVSACKTSNL